MNWIEVSFIKDVPVAMRNKRLETRELNFDESWIGCSAASFAKLRLTPYDIDSRPCLPGLVLPDPRSSKNQHNCSAVQPLPSGYP